MRSAVHVDRGRQAKGEDDVVCVLPWAMDKLSFSVSSPTLLRYHLLVREKNAALRVDLRVGVATRRGRSRTRHPELAPCRGRWQVGHLPCASRLDDNSPCFEKVAIEALRYAKERRQHTTPQPAMVAQPLLLLRFPSSPTRPQSRPGNNLAVMTSLSRAPSPTPPTLSVPPSSPFVQAHAGCSAP